jgi:hypothetical protein
MRVNDLLDLCGEVWFDVFLWALREAGNDSRVRFTAYSVQSNHLHAVLEAASPEALAAAVITLKGNFTAVANAVLGRKGPVFVRGYHVSVLKTPTQVRNALAYLVENAAHHAATGQRLDARILHDPFTPLGLLDLRSHRGWALRATGPLATTAPTCWLVRTGWQLQ